MSKYSISKAGSAVPSQEEAILAQQTNQLLHNLDTDKAYRFQVIQDDEPGDIVEIPPSAMQLIMQILNEIGKGNSVALTPVHTEITTQQAADILNVSRPYLIQLLENEEIPYRKVGTHRRLRFQDVLAYKQAIDAKRLQALNELSAYDQELGLQ